MESRASLERRPLANAAHVTLPHPTCGLGKRESQSKASPGFLKLHCSQFGMFVNWKEKQ